MNRHFSPISSFFLKSQLKDADLSFIRLSFLVMEQYYHHTFMALSQLLQSWRSGVGSTPSNVGLIRLWPGFWLRLWSHLRVCTGRCFHSHSKVGRSQFLAIGGLRGLLSCWLWLEAALSSERPQVALCHVGLLSMATCYFTCHEREGLQCTTVHMIDSYDTSPQVS